MSVRVVARVRPLWKSEREADVILRTGSSRVEPASSSKSSFLSSASKPSQQGSATSKDRDNIVRIPNPKNESEEYNFQFNAVYDENVTQQELFDAEVAPTIKHLFAGFDVTLFAYGVTGTGKTHTMRGGKSLADRGVIPRLLSALYRRSRKMEKDSNGESTVDVSLSYYEIYNDKVFDLFEPSEKRTLAGLPLRDNGGKTVVVGLTERPCPSLKDFEILYDQANINRSTSATKLNAHSSRSHAILCVKVTVTSGDKIRISTASAIDLAGSEDNRRTENDKERMVESASINKSLFVLAQCVEAISKKQPRIPYRESKMTRILSLGQNNGLTLMILNLAPIRSYHLDTLSSLNFANRTKKIEVREVENEPMFKGPPRPAMRTATAHRQPLRPLTASANIILAAPASKESTKSADGKPAKAFHVYSDKPRPRLSAHAKRPEVCKRSSITSDAADASSNRSAKVPRKRDALPPTRSAVDISAAKIEEMVEKKVEQILAARALNDQSQHEHIREVNEQMERRLEQLEQRIEGSEDARAEGLSYLLMAKQHQSRGEESSALRMYQLAVPFFPNNEKLLVKIRTLQERLQVKALKPHDSREATPNLDPSPAARPEHCNALSLAKETKRVTTKRRADDTDDDYAETDDPNERFSDDDTYDIARSRCRKRARVQPQLHHGAVFGRGDDQTPTAASPRTLRLLSVINSRDISKIKLLKGVGTKKAEAIIDCLRELDSVAGAVASEEQLPYQLSNLLELSKLRGVGMKTVENMRSGVLV